MNPETTPPASSNAPSCSAWCISLDDEYYQPLQFASREEAIKEGRDFYAGLPFYVGEIEPPIQPEEVFDCEDWLETVSCQDDYCGEHADGWEMSSKEQRQELNDEVQKVMAAWLDRHKLRPSFWNARNGERIEPLPAVEFVGIDGKPETDPNKCGVLRINNPAALREPNTNAEPPQVGSGESSTP